MNIDKKTMADLHSIAKETAKGIHKRTAIPGWHADESKFPEAEYTDILAMLVKAYQMGGQEKENAPSDWRDQFNAPLECP